MHDSPSAVPRNAALLAIKQTESVQMQKEWCEGNMQEKIKTRGNTMIHITKGIKNAQSITLYIHLAQPCLLPVRTPAGDAVREHYSMGIVLDPTSVGLECMVDVPELPDILRFLCDTWLAEEDIVYVETYPTVCAEVNHLKDYVGDSTGWVVGHRQSSLAAVAR